MSLRMERSLRQMRSLMVWAAGALVLLAILVGVLWQGRPWASVAVGIVAGLAILLVSMWTTTKVARSEVPHVGWVALDYVIKIAICAAVILWARAVGYLSVGVVGLLVIVAIVLGILVQLTAFTRPASRS